MNTKEKSTNSVMIIAGEPSGDLHGAHLVRELLGMNPDISIFGIGGHHLQDAGVEILVDAETLSVVGIAEVVSKLGDVTKGLNAAKEMLRKRRPGLLILIDFPDFNLMVAATAKRLGIPVLYYISPQIWAWRSGRVKKIGRLVDHMAVILPFEEKFYRRKKIPATFVGHPLLDHGTESVARAEIAPGDTPVIGILPGSRRGEISKHLPIMLKSAQRVSQSRKDARFLVSVARLDHEDLIKEIIKERGANPDIFQVVHGTDEVFENSLLLVAVSGTVTLEAAMAGVPTIAIYRVSPISYWLGRLLIKVEYMSLANLILERAVLPELIQDDVNPLRIAAEMESLLGDIKSLKIMQSHFSQIRRLLGGEGASRRVAKIALNMIKR